MFSASSKKIKNKFKKNEIIGNPTFIIKDLIKMLFVIENEILKIKEDIIKIQDKIK